MKLIYKLFKLDENTREGVVSATSILGIITNLVISLMKISVGLITSSIAIISEGVNNAADVATSVFTLVGTKLANKKRDAKHPFGHGRFEYLSSLTISIFILMSGFEVLKSSIERIINPSPLGISYTSLLLIFVAAIIKYLLGAYTIKNGLRVSSETLVALGQDSRNDSFVSIITIVSSLIFLIFSKSIDGFAGLVISILIIKTGYEIISKTISELLGEPADKDLATTLYKEIRSTKGVINAVDMILHNYGPDVYYGSTNVELDHKMTIQQAYVVLHDLQLRIMHEHNVMMVFGVYAVDKDSKESKKLHKEIAKYVKEHEHVKSYHAIFFDKKVNKIYCDIVVDYETEDMDKEHDDFEEYLQGLYPDKQIEVNVDTDFV